MIEILHIGMLLYISTSYILNCVPLKHILKSQPLEAVDMIIGGNKVFVKFMKMSPTRLDRPIIQCLVFL